jgi:hypothetical protein
VKTENKQVISGWSRLDNGPKTSSLDLATTDGWNVEIAVAQVQALRSARFCHTWVIGVHFSLTSKNGWHTIFVRHSSSE